MTSPLHRNRRTTRSSIRPRSCRRLLCGFAIVAALCGTCFADGNRPRKTGDDLLEALKHRSPAGRWERLQRVEPPPPAKPAPVENPTVVDPQTPQSETSAASPFPASPKGTPPRPVISEPAPLPVFDLEDDLRIVPPLTQRPARIKTPAKPVQLRKVSEIDPFPGFEPRYEGPLTKTKRVPKTAWKARKYQQSEFDQLRRIAFKDSALFTWEATDFQHSPLYFEDPALERYGHTYPEWLQPFASTARFSVQLVGLPYQMAIDPPDKCMYTLGWYRPGECAPQLFYQVPWDADAAAVEAGVITGLFFVIP